MASFLRNAKRTKGELIMTNKRNLRSTVNFLLALFFTASLLIACGGGGGDSGGTTTPPPDVFTVSTIDSAGDVGWYSSIATGSIHISYYDADESTLKYATAATESGPWTIDGALIDTSGNDVGGFSSIVVDSSDKVHISYYDWDSWYLKYATNASGSWVVNTIDTSADVGMFSSIAIDSVSAGENLHISYYDYDDGSIKYVTGAVGAWGTPIAFDNIGAGLSLDTTLISIQIDSNDKVHIVYYDDDTADLKYTNDVSGTLAVNVTTIESDGYIGTDVSVALDSSNNIHVGYYDSSNNNLKYATCLGIDDCTQSSNWSTEAVDSTADGDYSSIAVESDGTVHISYHDITTDSLKYSTGTSGSFTTETVDGTARVGEYSSIAVESDGTVHISYYDFDNGDIKYAVK